MKNGLISVNIKSVCKKLSSNKALEDVSFVFEEGLIHAIVGPNGAGKTTLIRLIISLLKADKGQIEYFQSGTQISFADIKEEIGYFPQEQSLYADLSCMEHLRFFAKLYNISDDIFENRAKDLLYKTGLSKFADRKAANLSGGMYKKLGAACVLLNRPKLLLLDEITIGVDPLSRKELWDLIRDMSKDMTIINSTSYMDEAQKCSKVHLLNEGHSLAFGKPQDLLKRFGVETFEEIFIKIQERKK